MGWLGDILKTGLTIGSVIPGPHQPFAMAGAAGVSAIDAAKKQGKADKLTQQQLDMANQRYAEGAPFRSKLAALANNLPREREDLSALFADPGNPYARSIPRPQSRLAQAARPQAPVQPPPASVAPWLKKFAGNKSGLAKMLEQAKANGPASAGRSRGNALGGFF